MAVVLFIQVRIDHRSKSLSFGTDLMVAQKEDVPEGPYIQSMPSEQIRNQLTSMSRVLHKAIKLVQPEDRQVDTESQLSQRNKLLRGKFLPRNNSIMHVVLENLENYSNQEAQLALTAMLKSNKFRWTQ